MRIQTNVESLNAYRNLGNTNKAMSQSMEKLSSGFRINRAADDAAGLAISEKMRGQVKGLDQATRNSQDATSMIQTAEGALNESHEILQRMRELTVQAANDTNTDEDIKEIQAEVGQLQDELTRIADNTEFNTKTLLNGDFASGTESLTFQIGANDDQNIDLNISNMSASALGTAVAANNMSGASVADINFENYNTTNTGISFQDYSDEALQTIDAAIGEVSSERSNLGSVQNRLEHTIANLEVAGENLEAAESRIRDVDMAKEMTNFSKQQILEQAGTAMLAQANQAPQSVLQLLG